MNKIILCLLLLPLLTASAQNKLVYYNWQWKPCEPGDARFVSDAYQTDSGWYRRDYFLETRKLQMKGLYTDSTCKFQNGFFTWYYVNGVVKSIGRYAANKKEGTWLNFYYNGMLEDSAVYKEGKPVGVSRSWHANGFERDSIEYNADGTAVVVNWFDNGQPAAAGHLKDGKLNGRWVYYHNNGQKAAVEDYADGIMADRAYYDEKGIAQTGDEPLERELAFPGGMEKWKKMMEKKLEFPHDVKLVNTDQITVVVNFRVDEEGNVRDAYVDVPFHPLFDEEALRVIKKSPQWIPEMKHNRRVSVWARQVIHFGQEEF